MYTLFRTSNNNDNKIFQREFCTVYTAYILCISINEVIQFYLTHKKSYKKVRSLSVLGEYIFINIYFKGP